VRKAENLPPSCAVVMKTGNLNFLEHSGPLRTCNGTALTFTYENMPYVNVKGSYEFNLCIIWSDLRGEINIWEEGIIISGIVIEMFIWTYI